MQRGNVEQMLKWVMIGGVAALGISGLNFAIGQGPLNIPRSEIDGWTITASYPKDGWPKMTFDLTVQNTEKKARDLELTAKLLRVEFKGNPASRVFNPKDMDSKELEDQIVRAHLGAGQAKAIHVDFRSQPDEIGVGKGMPRVTYELSLSLDGKRFLGASARRPAR